jgi:hypothetical protein
MYIDILMPTISTTLQNLQSQEDHYTGMKVVSFIIVLILAIVVGVKNYAFNANRKPNEPPAFTYQKIAFYSLIAIILLHILSHYIF